jgi:hypothetical protein
MKDGFILPFMVSLREMNDRSFENHERTMVELKIFFFNTLYLWTIVLEFPNVLDFYVFLDLFPHLTKCLSCMLFVYRDCAFSLFNKISITYKKNNHHNHNASLRSNSCSNKTTKSDKSTIIQQQQKVTRILYNNNNNNS